MLEITNSDLDKAVLSFSGLIRLFRDCFPVWLLVLDSMMGSHNNPFILIIVLLFKNWEILIANNQTCPTSVPSKGEFHQIKMHTACSLSVCSHVDIAIMSF